MIEAEIVLLHTLRIKKMREAAHPPIIFWFLGIKKFCIKIYITSLVSTS